MRLVAADLVDLLREGHSCHQRVGLVRDLLVVDAQSEVAGMDRVTIERSDIHVLTLGLSGTHPFLLAIRADPHHTRTRYRSPAYRSGSKPANSMPVRSAISRLQVVMSSRQRAPRSSWPQARAKTFMSSMED